MIRDIKYSILYWNDTEVCKGDYMNINQNQFELLSYIEQEGGKKLSQRQMADALNVSVGSINRILSELQECGLVAVGENREVQITGYGLKTLEPFRVKRVIILAAGFSDRLIPISINTPKPLIRVHGTPMIETLLNAIEKAEIREIVIVRGYLGEQFDVLKEKYAGIRFIDNPFYNEANNISSAWLARNYISDAYIMEADLVIKNPKVIRKYEFASNYLGTFKETTDDWCFEVKKGIISKVRVGGCNSYQMKGISYWNKEDGKKLAECIDQAWQMPGGKEKYWDEVALQVYMNEFQVRIRACEEEDLIEIDTFKELKDVDPIYGM